MKRKVKYIEQNRIDLEYVSDILGEFNFISKEKICLDNIKLRNETKNKLIEELSKCDDFRFKINETRFDTTVELITYKVEIESDIDFENRKKRIKDRNKKSYKKRKEKRESEEYIKYLELKKIYGDLT